MTTWPVLLQVLQLPTETSPDHLKWPQLRFLTGQPHEHIQICLATTGVQAASTTSQVVRPMRFREVNMRDIRQPVWIVVLVFTNVFAPDRRRLSSILSCKHAYNYLGVYGWCVVRKYFVLIEREALMSPKSGQIRALSSVVLEHCLVWWIPVYYYVPFGCREESAPLNLFYKLLSKILHNTCTYKSVKTIAGLLITSIICTFWYIFFSCSIFAVSVIVMILD